MTQMPDYDLTPGPDPDVPDDPMTCAYEDYQESDEWSKALSAVAGVKVDDVDIAPFTTRDIPLSEVVGSDAAIDVAAEGIIIGFEAGFRYGSRPAKPTLDDAQIGLLLRSLGHMSVDEKLIKRTRKTLRKMREALNGR